MEDFNWLITLLGLFVTLLIIIDVFLTVLHIDSDGPIARAVFHTIWWALMALVRTFPAARRSLVALAGPFMIAGAIAIWIGIFILGFALIYWPYMELFRADDGYVALGFIEALYFSGVTATVLGYGDISPMNNLLQVFSFIQSGLGFAMLTGIITYLINVVSGASERNALSLRFWALTGQTGNGSEAVIRSLSCEEIIDLRIRLQNLLDSTHNIHQKMHQFPILDLFYRSWDPVYSPEIMLRSAMQLSIATQILSSNQEYRRLKSVSEELGQVSVDMIELIASQHMSRQLHIQLKHPVPDEKDRLLFDQVRTSLIRGIPQLAITPYEPGSEDGDRILALIFRLRIFMAEADALTGWRMDSIGKKEE